MSARSRINVVFENALIVDSSAWAWVVDGLGGHPVVLRERAPRSAIAATLGSIAPHQHAAVLHDAYGVFAPGARHVIVGHSVGGLLAQYYAAVHPENVAGLVLVDSTHPDQFARSSIQLNAHLWLTQDLAKRLARAVVRPGLTRSEIESLDVLPPSVRETARRSLAAVPTWITAQRESRAATQDWAVAARRFHRTDIPVVVLVSQQSAEQDSHYATMQRELSETSARGSFVIVPDTTHESVVMSKAGADAVVAAINQVLSTEVASRG